MYRTIISEMVVGGWFVHKYRKQAAAHGIRSAAKNLRKQGVPVEIAIAILCW